MSSPDTYIVDVTYEDGLWVAVVADLPGGATDAETLEQLRDYTRDVISTLTGEEITEEDIVWRLPVVAGEVLGANLPKDQCAIHGYEPVPAGCFRICGECLHAYASEQELLDAHNDVLADMQARKRSHKIPLDDLFEASATDPAVSADQVHCCPMCTHDW